MFGGEGILQLLGFMQVKLRLHITESIHPRHLSACRGDIRFSVRAQGFGVQGLGSRVQGLAIVHPLSPETLDQRLQHPLTKEYTVNRTRDHIIF